MEQNRYSARIRVKNLDKLVASRFKDFTDVQFQEGTIRSREEIVYETTILSSLSAHEVRILLERTYPESEVLEIK
jgi:hypothetical protein